MHGTKNMQALALATFALLAAGPLGASGTPPLVRAHYELTLQQGRSTWTVGSAANVASGVPIRQDIGPYRLSLVARLGSHGHYKLDVSVGLIPHGTGAIYAPDSRSFEGEMELPLEFTTTLVGTTVKGAIMVARVRQGPSLAPSPWPGRTST